MFRHASRMFAVLATVALARGSARAAPFQDQLVQHPTLDLPRRGQVAGSLAHLGFGAADLSRGAFTLPMPVQVPDARGKLLAQPFPSWSAEHGVSEFGMGWSNQLSIRRYRVSGSIAYDDTDDFSSPWGRLAKGDDGAYYPAGVRDAVRVRRDSVKNSWQAVTAEGTTYTFAPADIVSAGTYAWMLSRIDTLLGDSTTFVWVKNPSGRPFLDRVRWGGRNDGTQYEASFVYETLPGPFASWVSGDKQLLDRRVTQIVVKAKQGATLQERWRYTLGYTTSPIGPAFYLTKLTRKFISGETEPAVVYDYDMGVEQLANAAITYNPNLDQYLAAAGVDSIQPDRAAMTDMEQNGLIDLEHNYSYTLVRQSESGFVFEPLPAATGKENPLCRPAPATTNKPRLLARLRGDFGDPEVVVLKKNGAGATTHLTVCNRNGMTQSSFDVDGNWELGANTRLSDIDADRKPDVVRVYPGGVQVLKNWSGPNDWTFAAMLPQTLTPAVTPVSSWVLDVNGDGRADLVARTSNTVMVWHGLGGGLFESVGQALQFTVNGLALSNLAQYQFSFGDFNNDGLEDAILSAGQSVSLFVNQGNEFVQRAVPGLRDIPFAVGYPVVADLSASGNVEVVFVDGGKAKTIALSSPSTGLLLRADDGKGTVARFGYSRVKPVPGIIQRYSLLASLTLDSAGYGAVAFLYQYEQPVWHSVGHFLVGFGMAEKKSPFLDEQVSFHNDDDVSGVVTRQSDRDDRTPGIERFSSTTLAAAMFHGVPLLRPSAREHGWRDATGAPVSARIDYVTYDGLCPTRTSASMPSGVLTKVEALAKVTGLEPELPCLPASQRLLGAHGDHVLDFDYRVDITRNPLGQVTAVNQTGPTGVVALQQNSYDGLGRLIQATVPGRGATSVEWDSLGRLAQVTSPEGLVVQSSMDPLTDAQLTLRRDRGSNVSENFGFAYDGQGRLARRWEDLSGTSSATPAQTLSYRYPSATQPGLITTGTLVQPGVSRTTVEITGGDGETVASAAWAGAWIFGDSRKVDRATLERTAEWIAPMAGGGAMTTLGWQGLYANATALAWQRDAGFSYPVATSALFQSNVSGSTATSYAIANGQLVVRTTQNGVYVHEQGRDGEGHVLRSRDESGAEHTYAYDALGRLVGVTTPDGGHRLRFDGYGRPARVDRDGLASVVYQYDTYGRQIGKRFLDGHGALVNAQAEEHDGVGRVTHIADTRADGATLDFWLSYDGNGAPGGAIAGQKGQLTHVLGSGFERTDRYDADGRALEQRVRLGDGWRQITRTAAYRADGAESARTIAVSDAHAKALLTTTNQVQVDGYGRPYRLLVDGVAAYTLGYDGEGRLRLITLADGHAVTPLYDAATHRRRGYQVTGPVQKGTVTWSYDTRGLGNEEDTTLGAVSHKRRYTRDVRGFLTAVDEDGHATAAYSYTASGLPSTTSDVLGARTVHHTGSDLDVGTVHYKWDALGRVVQRGDTAIEYGPDGQLAAAHRPGRELGYRYDQTGARVLELVNGTPTLGWAFGGTLTETAFVEPVIVEGITVGMLQNGVFTTLITDRRGTPVAGADGTPYPATTYGGRVSYAPLATSIDFTRLGHDADLGTVRMGVRDYDPLLGQFWTPDPLFLENLDRCQRSPVECGLFGYAGNDPLGATDRTGMQMVTDPVSTAWHMVVDVAALLNGQGKNSPSTRNQQMTPGSERSPYDSSKKAFLAKATKIQSDLWKAVATDMIKRDTSRAMRDIQNIAPLTGPHGETERFNGEWGNHAPTIRATDDAEMERMKDYGEWKRRNEEGPDRPEHLPDEEPPGPGPVIPEPPPAIILD